MVRNSIELSVGVSDPAALEELAADAKFEENLEVSIAETLNVDPNTVTIKSVTSGPDGKLAISYAIAF